MSQVVMTLRQYIEDNKSSIGSGPEDSCSLSWVNKARIVAYPLGDWVGTIDYIGAPTYRGSFILPSFCEAIREIRRCASDESWVTQSVPREYYDQCGGEVIMSRVAGRTYCPISVGANTLSFSFLNSKDHEVELEVKYIDTSGSMRYEVLKVPHQRKGSALLGYIPSRVLKIQKPVTVGRVEVCNGNEIGYIEPYETIPQYSIYQSTGLDCGGPLVVKVKKRCIAYTSSDLDSLIDINPEALTSLVIACRVKEDRSITFVQDYAALVTMATDFLKKELSNEHDTSRGTEPVNAHNYFFDDLLQETSAVYEQ